MSDPETSTNCDFDHQLHHYESAPAADNGNISEECTSETTCQPLRGNSFIRSQAISRAVCLPDFGHESVSAKCCSCAHCFQKFCSLDKLRRHILSVHDDFSEHYDKAVSDDRDLNCNCGSPKYLLSNSDFDPDLKKVNHRSCGVAPILDCVKEGKVQLPSKAVKPTERVGNCTRQNIAEPTSTCDKCFLEFKISDGYLLHSRECPAVHVSRFRLQLLETFDVGKVFQCRLCYLERRIDLECWNQYEGDLNCISCCKTMRNDITLHLHSNDNNDILCGFCTQKLEATNILKHLLKHHHLRSFLLNICSKTCLQYQFDKIPIKVVGKFSNKFTCYICFSSCPDTWVFQRHLNSHGIETEKFKKEKCPLCEIILFHSNLRTHILKVHKICDTGRTKMGELGLVTCGHCFFEFSSLTELSNHILTDHLEPNAECLNHTNSTRQKPSCLKSFSVFVPRVKTRMHNLDRFKNYLVETFWPGQLFKCQCCYLPRAHEVEIFKSTPGPIDCINCRIPFQSDITCHIHRSGNQLICGYCSKTLITGEISNHCENHLKDRSYLVNICSLYCLKTTQKVWPTKVTGLRRFKCLVCFRSCSAMCRLRDHMSSHEQMDRWFICNFCTNRYPTEDKLRKHLSVHYKAFNCPVCNSNYLYESELKRHLIKHHSNTELRCLVCGMVSRDTKEYVLHLGVHQNDNPENVRTKKQSTACTKCLDEFPDAASFVAHSKRCLDKFICAHCSRSFPTLGKMRFHINKIHFTLQCFIDKPYKCMDCSELFVESTRFKRHRQYHSGITYVCHICGAVMPSKKTLTRHINYHHCPPKFVCGSCNKRFKTTTALNQHVFYNHTDDFPFKCERCGNSFRRKKNLNEHVKNTCKAGNRKRN